MASALWTNTALLLASIPADIAKHYGCFPVRIEKDTIYIALTDPLNMGIASELERLLNKKIVYMLAPEDDIQRLINEYYGKDKGFTNG